MSGRNGQPFLVCDADNTLWDTDSVYRVAQLALLAFVEREVGTACERSDRLEYVREFDQALAKAHHLHLRYPPQLLVRALVLGLSGVGPVDAASHVMRGVRPEAARPVQSALVDEVTARFVGLLRAAPPLLPTVLEGLALASDASIEMLVLTEGKIERQKELLSIHGIAAYFVGVWEMTKDEAQFARLRARFQGKNLVVIGDQADRDVVPARNAGCTTILVPGGFRPQWQTAARDSQADYVATSFADAVGWAVEHVR